MYNKLININELKLFQIGLSNIVNRKQYSYYSLNLVYYNLEQCKQLLSIKLPKQYKDHISNGLLLELFTYLHHAKNIYIHVDDYKYDFYEYKLNYIQPKINHYLNMEIVYAFNYTKGKCNFYLDDNLLDYKEYYNKLYKSTLPLYKEFKDVFDAFNYTIKHTYMTKFTDYEYKKDHKHCQRNCN